MDKSDELNFLKCDLKNMIDGMTMVESLLSQTEKDHLNLHRRCMSVLERIEAAESEE